MWCHFGVDSRGSWLSMCARCVYVGYGGDIPLDKAPLLSSGVVSISGNPFAFAALKNDGSVVAFGDARTYIPLWSGCVLLFAVL